GYVEDRWLVGETVSRPDKSGRRSPFRIASLQSTGAANASSLGGPMDGVSHAIKEFVLWQRSQRVHCFDVKAVLEELLPSLRHELGHMEAMPEFERHLFFGEVLLQISQPSEGADDEAASDFGIERDRGE